jgi:transposase-like protein
VFSEDNQIMSMKSSPRKYAPQFRAEAVQMVVVTGRPVAHIATELGIGPQLLGRWVQAYRDEHPDPGGPSPVESARIRELEDQCRQLRMENEFLKKATAFFARTLPL